MAETENTNIPFEEFRLIFRHDFINEYGRRIPLDEPITGCIVTRPNEMAYMQLGNCYVKNEILHRLIHELERYMEHENYG